MQQFTYSSNLYINEYTKVTSLVLPFADISVFEIFFSVFAFNPVTYYFSRFLYLIRMYSLQLSYLFITLKKLGFWQAALVYLEC